jgi:hypothetical protein
MRSVAANRLDDDKQKELATRFYRKGNVGGWKKYFVEENLEAWNTWVQTLICHFDSYSCIKHVVYTYSTIQVAK